MLRAENREGTSKIAWESEKIDAPFICPDCREKVILKKGVKNIHHFSHKPPVNCIYGKGESQKHYETKKGIYDFLKSQSNCSDCELERNLKEVRPDISFYLNRTPIAIEVQKSTIDIYNIKRRMLAYTRLGIHVLWVMPDSEPSIEYRYERNEYVHRIREWELFIHAMYYGRIYHWVGEGYLKAVHYDPFRIYKEESEWFGEGGEFRTAGGYSYTAKRLKKACFLEDTLSITKSFEPRFRQDSFSTKHWVIPPCRIFIDSKIRWW